MASIPKTFIQQRSAARSAGIAIVRNIFRTQQFADGVSTKHLYKLALQEPAPEGFKPYPLARPFAAAQSRAPKYPSKSKKVKLEAKDLYPPNPEHPIRSIRFLKTEILAELKATEEIGTFRQPKANARLAEEVSDPTTKRERKKLAASQMEFVWKPLPPKPTRLPPRVKEVVGTEVGVGADISHLNKRRQRARVEKVSLAVQKMKAINNGLKVRPQASRPLYRNARPMPEDTSASQ